MLATLAYCTDGLNIFVLSLVHAMHIELQAFGIGALEEEDAEDDVYGVESMTSYDLTLAGEGDIATERKYGWTGSHGAGMLCVCVH